MRKISIFICTLLCSVSSLFAQTKEVTGKVTDAKNGAPIVGATIKAKGYNNSTTTDADGSFKLAVDGKAVVMEVSYVGYNSQNTTIGNGNIVVKLEEADRSLSEVVVVGFGTKLKRELTGSVAKVGAKELNNTPASSFESAIQGRAAGVLVSQQNGKLGQGINIRIRGSASVTAGNEPLYVIDGIPLQNTDLSSNGATTNSLSDINTNDIESIEILKDASAAAIYGSRGSNGVVLITTKKGKAGKSKIEFGYFTGKQKPTGKRDFLNAKEYVDYFTMAAANAFRLDSGFDYVAYTASRLKRYSAGNTDYQTAKVNTKWQDQAFQEAPISQYDLNFSGGNDKTTFYMGGQVLDQSGIIVGNSLKRYSGRLNLEHKVKDWLSLGVNMSFARTINNRVSNDNAFSTPLQIVALSPITPLIDPRTGLTSGALDLNTGNPNTNYPVYYNPILSVENTKYKTSVNRTIGNLFAQATIARGFTFRSEFGMDQLNQNEDQYSGRLTARNQGVPNGSGFSSSDQILNINTNNFFRYVSSFGEYHDIDIVAGTSFQKWQIVSNSASAEEFPSDSYKKLNAGASKTAATSTASDWALLSYFTRANYKLKDRYLLSVSGRYDGSSRFGANNRYGFFPAVSAGWILSDEHFLKNVRWLSFLKLKASYGLTGNSEVGNYASRGLYGPNAYGGLGGQSPTQLPNTNLKWESTTSLDMGIEASALNRRVTIEVDYYERKTKDLLLSVNVPSTTGFLSKLQNVGKLENKGIEFTINTENIVSKDFRWSTSINFGANKNKITDLGGQQIGTLNRAQEGQPLGVFFAKEFAGANPANGDALYFKNTVKTDGTKDRTTTKNVNEAEDVRIGNPNPEFIYGFRNTFTYKGFDVDVLLQGVQGNQIFNGGGQYMSGSGSNGFDNQTTDQLAAWKKPGDITMVPEARLFFANGTDNSSRYISDGSYLRIKAITLGFNLSPKLLSVLHIDRARFYIRAQNLFTITKYKGWDPEVNSDATANNISLGNDFYSAPQIKTIVFGVNIGL
ncbi:MAG: TonB-dependent receptor [Ferruginibacter sp.]|nr:TonB-dependent receptor [Ferruginibacter sp.]